MGSDLDPLCDERKRTSKLKSKILCMKYILQM
jgi:hypothetical protein